MSDITLSFELHEFVCPHCQKQTQHSSPGATVLFANVTCQHCGKEFLIVQGEPRKEDQRNGGRPTV